MKDYFQMLAHYNAWANNRLYASCEKLHADDYFLDRKAYFHSIHGTLNHLLVGDRLWLGRWESIDSGIKKLDEILYANFQTLRKARKEEDQRLIDFINTFPSQKLDASHLYRNLSGEEKTGIWKLMFAHLFNHQTHHRGQVHNMLSQARIEAPVLDLHYYFIDKGSK
jgi:uncharacterized damage-inducible protein DinB